jgi:4-hydroxybenzoyl-CoA reductase subunit beta
MLLPEHDFVKPPTLADGLRALAAAPATTRILAGGTDVIFNMRGRLFAPAVLLSIRDLPELKGVSELPDGSLRIGAASRLTDLEAEPVIQARHPALVEAFRAVASRHVRNMATLGGNLCLDTRCWYTNQTQEWRTAKGPCLKTGSLDCHVIRTATTCVALNNADTPPALIALDARVTLARSTGERTIQLVDFYRPDGVSHTVREADEILTAVIVPPTTDRFVFLKDAARQGIDFSYGTVAARADGAGEKLTRIRIVIGSVSSAPIVLRHAGAILEQRGLGDAAIGEAADAIRDELGALNNLYTPAAYKRELAKALVQRAMQRLREMRR